jgi:hypothetical protein
MDLETLTLPQEPQDLLSPSMLAPHLGQLLWKLTRTVEECILLVKIGVRSELYIVASVVAYGVGDGQTDEVGGVSGVY